MWDCATEYAKGELLVLLALADWANDEGHCHPSVPRIANKSRLTERQVYNVLKQLQADGAISIDSGGGRGKLTSYQIHVEQFSGSRYAKKKSLANGSVNPEKVSVKSGLKSTDGNPEICDTETLKSATRNPEIFDNPPDPLLGRTVREPSEGTVKEHSPYPLSAERVKSPQRIQVDAVSFGRFRLSLRRQLEDQPAKHPNFSDVVKGEWDFNACFRDWWLVRHVRGQPVITEAANPEATRRGLEKYRKRIEGLMREHFGGAVAIEVVERGVA